MRAHRLSRIEWQRFALLSCVFVLLALPQVVVGWTIDLSQLELHSENFLGQLEPITNLTVRVPINVKNIPANWRQADLVVGYTAIFNSGDDEDNDQFDSLNVNSGVYPFVGASTGQVTRSDLFLNGSYQGFIAVPSSEFYGIMTNDLVVMSIAVARKGNECLALGIGCYAEGGGECPEASTFQYVVYECSDDNVLGGIGRF